MEQIQPEPTQIFFGLIAESVKSIWKWPHNFVVENSSTIHDYITIFMPHEMWRLFVVVVVAIRMEYR